VHDSQRPAKKTPSGSSISFLSECSNKNFTLTPEFLLTIEVETAGDVRKLSIPMQSVINICKITFSHRNRFVLPFSLTMDAHELNAPPAWRIVGYQCTNPRCGKVFMYLLRVNTGIATMPQGLELFALVS
jgi:hypothetical protein